MSVGSHAKTVFGLAAALLLVGCAAISAAPRTPPQSVSRLARGAFQSWSNATAFRFVGTEMLPTAGTLRFTVTESSDGRQGEATGTLNGKPFRYLATSGKQYLQGQSFWREYAADYGAGIPGTAVDTTLVKGFGDKYVQVDDGAAVNGVGYNEVATALPELTRLAGSITDLNTDVNTLRRGNDSRTIDGRQATPLRRDVDNGAFSETFWISQGKPDQLVGFNGVTRDVYSAPFNVTIVFTQVPHVRPPTQGDTVSRRVESPTS